MLILIKKIFHGLKYQISKIIPDKLYLQTRYRRIVGEKLNLKNPRTFNEKLQWLKLYDRKPIYTTMVDKYAAKKYVADIIGKEHIIPALGVWNHFDEIDFDGLPNQFVLKCTHDSASVVICKDKQSLNQKATKEKLERSLKRNYYFAGREWPYKNVKPRILAEKYMEDESGSELKDYKIFCFNGEPRLIQVDYNRFSGHKRNLYDTDWNYLEMMLEYPADPSKQIPRPERLEDMLFMARKLSDGMIFARVDFYSKDEEIYFGEITFYPGSGIEKFVPENWDMELGNWIKLPGGGGNFIHNNIYVVPYPNSRICTAA